MAELLERYEMFLKGIKFDLENELKHVCPVDKGRLKNSIKVQISANELRILMVDYGMAVEFGTKAHIIKPKNKKALSWTDKSGKKRVAKVVHHPGTKPQPFIRNTFYHKLKPIVLINAERYIPELLDQIEVSIA